jgi:hypothetical protein
MSASVAMPIFDTLKYADALKEAGFTDAQARAQVQMAADIVEADFERFATKDDLHQLGNDIRSEIEQVRSEIKLGNAILDGKINQFGTESREAVKRLTAELVLHRWVLGVLVGTSLATMWRVFTLPH